MEARGLNAPPSPKKMEILQRRFAVSRTGQNALPGLPTGFLRIFF